MNELGVNSDDKERELEEQLKKLPKEKWNRENVLSLVKELMSETPFSYSIDDVIPLK